MPASTLDLTSPSIDGSGPVAYDIADVSADTLDKIITVVYSEGIPVLSKKSENLTGGSKDEIDIADGVKYELKFTVDDCLVLAEKGAVTYLLSKIVDGEPVALWTGDITTSTVSPTTPPVLGVERKIYYKDGGTTAVLADYNNGDMLFDPVANDLLLKDNGEWKTIFNGA